MAIKDFEQLTKPLTPFEAEVRDYIIPHLSNKKGKASSVSNAAIRAGLLKEKEWKISEIRMRKIIYNIRYNNLIPMLASGGKGYFVAITEQEMRDCIESLKDRMRAQGLTVEVLNDQLLEYLRGRQLSLKIA